MAWNARPATILVASLERISYIRFGPIIFDDVLRELPPFAASRVAVVDSARTLFRNLPAAALADRIAAISAGFTAVGIN